MDRLTVGMYILNVLGLLVTSSAGFYVKSELAETRILILREINEAGKDYVQRREFDGLDLRIGNLERIHIKP